MSTLRRLVSARAAVPQPTLWYLSDLMEARGRQDLFTRQAPERLKALREHALIESAVSSNRIEGVEVDRARVGTVVFGRALLRDRDEEEVRGYRQALDLIHTQGPNLALTEDTIKRLHALSRGEVWDSGQYKAKDGDIIETYPDGRSRVRFRTVSAANTPAAMARLVEDWQDCVRDQAFHPLVALAAFNLDFLCVHPFRDGNGRVSRLLILLQLYHLGFGVGRYVSIERLIEAEKLRYYETLEVSSQGWHEGKNDAWPFANYLFSILRTATRELERRLGEVTSPRGTKTALIVDAIRRQPGPFRIADVERDCPAVGRDWIRTLLVRMREGGDVCSDGRGTAARWRYVRKVGTDE